MTQKLMTRHCPSRRCSASRAGLKAGATVLRAKHGADHLSANAQARSEFGTPGAVPTFRPARQRVRTADGVGANCRVEPTNYSRPPPCGSEQAAPVRASEDHRTDGVLPDLCEDGSEPGRRWPERRPARHTALPLVRRTASRTRRIVHSSRGSSSVCEASITAGR